MIDDLEDVAVQRSLLIDRLAEAGHGALVAFAAARGYRLPPWAELTQDRRDRARVVIVELVTPRPGPASARRLLEELLELLP